MRTIICSIILLVGCNYFICAQSVGIGTTHPLNTLHIVSDSNVATTIQTNSLKNYSGLFLKTKQGANNYLELVKYGSGAKETIAGVDESNLTVIATSAQAGSLLLGTLSNNPCHIFTNGSEKLRINADGQIGVGAADPAFALDINGRARIRSNKGTAGIWFNSESNTYSPGFVGMYNDKVMGFYGNIAGWGFLSNVGNGNVAINSLPNTSKVKINASSGPALEISGAIKVSGTNPFAFQISANSSNISDYAGNPSIILDYPLCNNDPNAMLFVTAVSFADGVPVRMAYDPIISKWRIVVLATYEPIGLARSYIRCDAFSCKDISYSLSQPTSGFVSGDIFNILIIKTN